MSVWSTSVLGHFISQHLSTYFPMCLRLGVYLCGRISVWGPTGVRCSVAVSGICLLQLEQPLVHQRARDVRPARGPQWNSAFGLNRWWWIVLQADGDRMRPKQPSRDRGEEEKSQLVGARQKKTDRKK